MDGIDGIDSAEKQVNNKDRREKKMTVAIETPKTLSKTSDQWVTTGRAAELLDVGSINTIKRWLKKGILVGRQLGGARGQIRISLNSIEALLATPLEQELAKTNRLGSDLNKEVMEDLSWRKIGPLPWDNKR